LTDKADIKQILEIGCGEGMLSRNTARHLPNTEYHGVDVHEMYIKNAQSLADNEGIKNVSYSVRNVEHLPDEWTQKFDWIIMYDVLHDLPHPKESIDEIKRVLKDDGMATIVDPKLHSQHRGNIGDIKCAGMGYAGSCFFCLPCSSAEESSAKNGIGWGEQKKQALLEENGWLVKDKRMITNNPFEFVFTCCKNL